MGKLDGKVAIITGASRGLGRDMALAFAREGAKVVAAARTLNEGDFRIPGSLSTTVDRIRAGGGEAIAVHCDVTNDEEMEQTVQRTIAEYGRVDVLINNGAVRVPGTLEQMQVKHWDLIFRINLRGPFILSRLVLPYMAAQGGGHIINITSGSSRTPGNGPYTSVNTIDESYGITKAALERYTQALAAQVWDKNVAVNAMGPGTGISSEGGNFFRGDTGDRPGMRPTGEIFGDAAVAICLRQPRYFTGNILTDEEIIALDGGDLSRYPVTPRE